MNKEIFQRKLLALRLHAKTKSKYAPHCDIPTFSFEELGVPFQAPIAMDLRNAGICVLGTTSKALTRPANARRVCRNDNNTVPQRTKTKEFNLRDNLWKRIN